MNYDDAIRGIDYAMNWRNENPDAVKFAEGLATARQALIDARGDKERLDWLGAQFSLASRPRHPEDGLHWLKADNHAVAKGKTFREAIDIARTTFASVGGKLRTQA